MRLSNAERLKRLYVLGKLQLEELMEQIDAHLEAGTLDDSPPKRGTPEEAAANWSAAVSAKAANYSTIVEREFSRRAEAS